MANEEQVQAGALSQGKPQTTDELEELEELLELVDTVSNAEDDLEGRIEMKGAGTFARMVRALAESVGGRASTVLEALATVIARADKAEFPALAAILRRVAPKSIADQAAKIAGKMDEEGGDTGYAQPYGEQYPAPQSKAEPPADLRPVVEQLQQQVQTLGSVVEQLKSELAAVQKSLAAVPMGQPVARSVAPAQWLVDQLGQR